MTVSELIEMLQDKDPDAEVLTMTQLRWPFENTIQGVCDRAAMHGEEDEGEDNEDEYGDGQAASDVFLVEGSQIRYGNSKAWDVCEQSSACYTADKYGDAS